MTMHSAPEDLALTDEEFDRLSGLLDAIGPPAMNIETLDGLELPTNPSDAGYHLLFFADGVHGSSDLRNQCDIILGVGMHRNAFRPRTVDELAQALDYARDQADVGCVLITGAR